MSPRDLHRDSALVLRYHDRPWGSLLLWLLVVAGLLAAALAA